MNIYLQINFYTNFNNIAIMISGINHKLSRLKQPVKMIFSLAGLVTPEGTFSFLSLLKIKQSKSLVSLSLFYHQKQSRKSS